MSELSRYSATPRRRDLAPDVYGNRNKALIGLVVAIAAGYVAGAFMSLFTRRSSLPWEPSHAVIGGTIWAVVLVSLALLVLYLLQRYVWLFERGTAAYGFVIASGVGPPGGQCWVRIDDRGSSFVALLVGESHPPGTPVVAIHQAGSKLVLLATSPGHARRASKWRAEDLPPEIAAATR